MRRHVVAKDTHGRTLRMSPPLVITSVELQWAVEQLVGALEEAAQEADA